MHTRTHLNSDTMARVARRSLRIQALPLFSLGQPWQSVCNSSSVIPLRLFEPRYLELARRALPPKGKGEFGYSEQYPPKVGTSGVLARAEDCRWSPPKVGGSSGGEEQQTRTTRRLEVFLNAHAVRRFRILSVKPEVVDPKQPPLYVANVQLLEERDVARSAPIDAWTYWMQSPAGADETATDETSDKTAESLPKTRLGTVNHGTSLVATQGAPVFQSPESWTVVAQVSPGVAVVASGPPKMVEGYMMVPILPEGAVELVLFKELAADGSSMPTEEDMKWVLNNLNKAMGENLGPSGPVARRKSRRKLSSR